MDPDWKYSGRGRMSRGNAELTFYWNLIETYFNSKTKKLCEKAMYRALLKTLKGFANAKKIAKQRALILYEKFSKYGQDGVVTFDMIKKIPKDELRELINEYIEPPEASNSCDHEYFHFSPDDVYAILEDLAEYNNNAINKIDFIETYVRHGGHKSIAEEIWTKYGGVESEVNFQNSKEILKKALEKFEIYRSVEDEEDVDMSDRNDIVGGFESEERKMRPDFRESGANSLKLSENESENPEKTKDEL